METLFFESYKDIKSEEWPWPNFAPSELACKHCGELKIVIEFMDLLQALRNFYDKPIRINSGYRCGVHNVKVSTTGKHGPHTTGAAADLKTTGAEAYRIAKIAFQVGFTGIGINQRGSGRFVHVDISSSHPRPMIWSY